MFYNTLNIFSTIGLAPGALGGMNTVLGWKCLLSNKILDFLNVFILSDTPPLPMVYPSLLYRQRQDCCQVE